jgi:hypothetical protein
MNNREEQSTEKSSSDILEAIFQETIHQREASSNKEILEIFEAVVDTWKSEIYRNWIPISHADHFCSVAVSGTTAANYCILDNVIFTLYKTKDGKNHACIKDYCTGDALEDLFMHHRKVKTYNDIYVCTYSGKPHYCNDFCSICNQCNSEIAKIYGKSIYNKDGTMVCPLTGITFNVQKNVSKIDSEFFASYDFEDKKKDYKDYNETFGDRGNYKMALARILGNKSQQNYDPDLNVKLSKSDFSDTRHIKMHSSGVYSRKRKETDEYEFQLDEGLHQTIKNVLNSKCRTEVDIRNFRRNSRQSMKSFYLYLACVKIADLLSPSRLQQYEENNDKKTQKLIKPFTSYVNKCYQTHEIPNICELSRIMRKEEKSLYVPPNIKLPLGHQVFMVIEYAKLCVCAWYAIITHTECGRTDVGSFKFTAFVDAFMSMIKTGYSIQLSGNSIIDVYKKDKFIGMIPNIEEEDRKKGDYPSRHKRKHVSLMKKKIQGAISDTIIKQNIHYNKLAPYSYQFEGLDECRFVEIKEWQKNKSHSKKKRQTAKQEEKKSVEELIEEECQRESQKNTKRVKVL